eukprot:TRINITY_DN37056_c0_g1_i1.p1 TRINITY_DN37056_c0_g1~~TRINITY_DN37056_c0_g1_i1.p1  ORF type:complete len:469 (+),score=95.01 TRINITY_DN37056_c0_g1_i1:75-1481(+)
MVNAPSERLERVSARGLNDTAEWARNTNLKLQQAQAGKDVSGRMRHATEQVQRAIEKETQDSINIVTSCLNTKIAETASLKRKLEKSLRLLSGEIELLESRQQKTIELMFSQRNPLETTHARMKERGTLRPPRENVIDAVQEALQEEAAGLTASAEQLSLSNANMSRLLKRMVACRTALEDDVADKTRALQLDRSCLDVEQQTVDKVPTPLPISSIISSQNDLRHICKQSSNHPVEWKRHSQKLISLSASLLSESTLLRKRAGLREKQAVQTHKKYEQNTKSKFEGKIRDTCRLHDRISSKLADVENEIAYLRKEKEAVTSALRKKEDPLKHCTKRLCLRRQRPSREAVRDEAERCLHTQLDRIMNNIKEYEQHLSQIVKRETELTALRRELLDDKRDKARAKELDSALLSCSDFGASNSTFPSNPEHFFMLSSGRTCALGTSSGPTIRSKFAQKRLTRPPRPNTALR